MARQARLWKVMDGEPWMVNAPNPYPSLAVYNPRRKRYARRPFGSGQHRPRVRLAARGTFRLGERSPYKGHIRRVNRPRPRRRTMARRMPEGLRRYWATHRRGRKYTRRRRHARNAPNRGRHYGSSHRVRHRRRGYARNPRVFGLNVSTQAIMAGVAAGLIQMYGAPYIARWLNLYPSGLMFRGAQAGLAVATGMAARWSRMVSPATADAITGYGVAIAVLGLIQDFQSGALMTPAVAPAAPGAPTLTGMGDFGYYETTDAYPNYPNTSGLGYFTP